jgi:uncharacterized protein with HEPN domain
MDKEIQTWLFDILQFIEEVDSYFEENQRIFEIYRNDIKTKRAIERNLEIIGEAVNRILKKDSTFNIVNAKQIIGTRNRIAHGYDTVSDDFIWSIVINHLPKLKEEITILLNSQ